MTNLRGLALLLCLFSVACPLVEGGDPPDGGDLGDGGELDGGDGGPPGPFVTCAEGALNECFSNQDCLLDDFCLDVGEAPNFVPCCIPGARGTLAAGENCDPLTGQSECASSLCLEGTAGIRCTETCSSDAECPVGMQKCTFIAFSGSNDRWCLFE